MLLLAAVIGLLVGISPVLAQLDMTGKEVKGLIFPEYGNDGNLVWRLKGDATFDTNEKVRLKNAQLETFDNGKRGFLFTSLACSFDLTKKAATTDQDVKILGDYYVIEGNGFEWTSEEGRMIIRHNVRVTMANVQTHLSKPGQANNAVPTQEKNRP